MLRDNLQILSHDLIKLAESTSSPEMNFNIYLFLIQDDFINSFK